MNTSKLKASLLLSLLVLFACAENPAIPLKKHSAEGAVVSQSYRNLFHELGADKANVEARVESIYQQLFFGDPQSESIYFQSGSNENGAAAYIEDIHNNDVRSEGMSYGMMICVQLDKKAEFDALWNWTLSHMYHSEPEHPAHGYFSWSLKTDGEPVDELPAPDGEEYFVTALYFASERWGDGEGIYNYSKYADQILLDMRHRKVISGMTATGQKSVGNVFDEEHKMVRFTPDLTHSEHTDPSYHVPAFYQVWALLGPESEREYWSQAAQVSRDFFIKSAHPKTGLTPDYANFDGSPWLAPWRKSNPSSDFRHDAWRTAMNWSMDWAWWAQDQRQKQLSDRLQTFFYGDGEHQYVSLYSLEGKPLDANKSSGLVAMNAVASLAATESPVSKSFVEALWQQPVPTGEFRYYNGMLYMLAYLNCSGQYRAWLHHR